MKPSLPLFLSLLGCGVDSGPRPATFTPYAQEILCEASDRGYFNDIQVTETGCTLTNILVDGDIYVREGAQVTIDLAAVTGSVLADEAEGLVLTGTEVDGFVRVTGGGAVHVIDSDIIGSVRIEGNAGLVGLRENRIEGDLQALANTGGVVVRDNAIGGNLQCEDNAPSPTGGGNTVGGNNDGQCGDL